MEEAGSYPSDKHYKSLIEEAKRNAAEGLNRQANLEDNSEQLRTAREGYIADAVEEVKQLTRTIHRMIARRDKLYKLEKKLQDMGPRGPNLQTLVEVMEYDRAKDNLMNRIRLERENMERNAKFASDVTKNIAYELNGL